MSDVASASCDLVFSGQNIEHLWPGEAAGFLAESARVLRSGGHLVVDSPNRALTAALNWSHPEHTVELTVEEITQLLNLSGFDVMKCAGLWLCRDPRTGRVLPFDANAPESEWTVTERLIAALDTPGNAFLWWVEARRNDRPPDQSTIADMLANIFREHWPERVQRLIVAQGRSCEPRDDGVWITASAGEAGLVFFGPSMPLRAGCYRCSFQLRSTSTADGPYAECEVTTGANTNSSRRSQQAAYRNVFIQIRPVDAYAFADESPIVALLRCSV
jgi:Methyltransferase domain